MKYLKLFEEYTQEGQVICYVGDVPIRLKIAATEQEKTKGYMFSDGPQEGEGMLFVYPNEEILTFWMKNVTVPLDILFFDSSMNLVDYKTMLPYNENDDEVFYDSELPAKFALELPHGWIERNLDLENTKLRFE
jgi:uncharacterized membrane protein (UPF0127 family)